MSITEDTEDPLKPITIEGQPHISEAINKIISKVNGNSEKGRIVGSSNIVVNSADGTTTLDWIKPIGEDRWCRFRMTFDVKAERLYISDGRVLFGNDDDDILKPTTPIIEMGSDPARKLSGEFDEAPAETPYLDLGDVEAGETYQVLLKTTPDSEGTPPAPSAEVLLHNVDDDPPVSDPVDPEEELRVIGEFTTKAGSDIFADPNWVIDTQSQLWGSDVELEPVNKHNLNLVVTDKSYYLVSLGNPPFGSDTSEWVHNLMQYDSMLSGSSQTFYWRHGLYVGTAYPGILPEGETGQTIYVDNWTDNTPAVGSP